MSEQKGFGAALVRMEKKNPLLFRTFYSAILLEFTFLAVILAFALFRALAPEAKSLQTAIGWLEPMELAVSLVILPIYLGAVHFRALRREGKYIFFKNIGWMLIPCLALTLLVSTVNDLLGTWLFDGKTSVSPEMILILAVVSVLGVFVVGMVCQMILVFLRARNE